MHFKAAFSYSILAAKFSCSSLEVWTHIYSYLQDWSSTASTRKSLVHLNHILLISAMHQYNTSTHINQRIFLQFKWITLFVTFYLSNSPTTGPKIAQIASGLLSRDIHFHVSKSGGGSHMSSWRNNWRHNPTFTQHLAWWGAFSCWCRFPGSCEDCKAEFQPKIFIQTMCHMMKSRDFEGLPIE